MPEILKKPLNFYVQSILEGNPYSFARYGDGEWSSVMEKKKHPQKNCDGHFYFKLLRDEFRWVFRGLRDEPQIYDYLLGMQNMSQKMWGGQIDKFLRGYSLQDREWHDADVFHHASRKGRLGPLVDALKLANVIVVGPGHLRVLDRVFGYNEFVRVPRQNCHLQTNEIVAAIQQAIDRAPKPVVVSISASMPAEIIIHRLYKDNRRHAFLIDFGSVFDPYAGVVSRKYHQGLRRDDIQTISPGTQPNMAAGSLRRPGASKGGQRRRR